MLNFLKRRKPRVTESSNADSFTDGLHQGFKRIARASPRTLVLKSSLSAIWLASSNGHGQ